MALIACAFVRKRDSSFRSSLISRYLLPFPASLLTPFRRSFIDPLSSFGSSPYSLVRFYQGGMLAVFTKTSCPWLDVSIYRTGASGGRSEIIDECELFGFAAILASLSGCLGQSGCYLLVSHLSMSSLP
jgi:hypothetical protein